MRRLLLAAAFCAAFPAPALAVRAWLSWSPSAVVTDLTTPGELNNLYVRIEDAPGFKGGEIDLSWNPSGNPDDCMAHIGTLYKGGADCTYLNRGSTVPVVTIDEPGRLHVAWANTLSNDGCTEGNAVVLQFAFNGCPTQSGCFVFHCMKTLDASNVLQDVTIEGATATVLGGGALCGDGNLPPDIEPLADYVVPELEHVEFTVVASDPDCETVTIQALQLPAGATFSAGVFRWTPSASQSGEYDVVFTAIDSRGASSADTSHITVLDHGANQPPDLETIPDQHLVETQHLVLTVHATDAEGGPITYSASPLPPGATFTGDTFDWTPALGQEGVYTIEFTATDDQGATDAQTVSMRVGPYGTSNAGAKASLSWSPTGVDPYLTDPTGVHKLYVFVEDAGSFKGADMDLTWFPPGDGATCVAHVSTQYRGGTDCVYMNRGVTSQFVEQDVPGAYNVTWTNSATAVDCTVGGSIIVLWFDFSGCLTDGACFTLTNLTLFDALDQPTTATIASATAIVNAGTEFCGVIDLPPFFPNPLLDQKVLEGETLRFTVVANDPNGDSLTYSADPIPLGAEFVDQRFTWTPTVGQAGDYTVRFTATDPYGASASDVVVITVRPDSTVFHVDGSSACTACDGKTWETAFHTIREGIDEARATSYDSILVAEGVYLEQNLSPPPTARLVGGYAHGGGERDVLAHHTIIAPPNPDAAGSLINVTQSSVVVDGFFLTGVRGGPPSVLSADGADIELRQLLIGGNREVGTAIVWILQGSTVTLDRVLIANDVVTPGAKGMIYVEPDAALTMERCSVSNDSTGNLLGATGLFTEGAATVHNSILWGLRPFGRSVIVRQLDGSVQVTYSDIAGGFPGAGNLDVQPLFCSVKQREFGLHANSPLVTAGEGGTIIGALDVACDINTNPEPDPLTIDTSAWIDAQPTDVRAPAPHRRTAVLSVTPAFVRAHLDVRIALADDHGDAAVDVVTPLGGVVASLARGRLPAGEHTLAWDTRSRTGQPVPSGVYVLRFHAGRVTETRRFVVLR